MKKRGDVKIINQLAGEEDTRKRGGELSNTTRRARKGTAWFKKKG